MCTCARKDPLNEILVYCGLEKDLYLVGWRIDYESVVQWLSVKFIAHFGVAPT